MRGNYKISKSFILKKSHKSVFCPKMAKKQYFERPDPWKSTYLGLKNRFKAIPHGPRPAKAQPGVEFP